MKRSESGAMPRVLLVEDNEINQEIACELLRGMHADVTVAENGEQAVAAVKSGQYDIIFMDIEMPVMDGREATRQIRKSDMDWAQRVPIIAMTGHDLSAGHDLFEGMNAHLTKPIDPQALENALKAWLPRQAAPKPAPERAPDKAAKAGQSGGGLMEQLRGINAAAGVINVAGNEKLYFDLLRRFAAKYRDSQHELPALVAQGEIESASRLAHTINGVAANLGAVQLAEMAKKLEIALLAGEAIDHLLVPYAEELARVTGSIDDLMRDKHKDQQESRQLVEVDAASVPFILQALEDLPKLMQTDWGQAQEIVVGLAPLLEATVAGPAHGRLLEALEEFDVVAFTDEAEKLAGLLG